MPRLAAAGALLLGLALAATSALPTAALEPSASAVLVDCNTTKGAVTLALEPSWAPLGVKRYLELVEAGFFSEMPLFRCVDRFLCQFGYADAKLAWEQRFPAIQDDPALPHLRRFHRGYISAAGNGRGSRSTNFFVTLGEHVESLGREPWETPLGFVLPADMQRTVARWETSYGDMPPWGRGPDPNRIRAEGRRYLASNFPKLDYWTGCRVRGSVVAAAAGEEMLLENEARVAREL